MASEFISGYPAPLALPVGTPNGTEVFPADQVVSGKRTTVSITSTSLFKNLSINYATGAVSIGAPSAGQALALTGASAGTAALAISTSATTGAQTVALAITNKPGVSGQTTPAKWIPIVLDGTTYYVPAFS